MVGVSAPSGGQRAITLRWEAEWKLQIFVAANLVSHDPRLMVLKWDLFFLNHNIRQN